MKKPDTHDHDEDAAVATLEPVRYLTLFDGTRPVYIRILAVDGFHGLGDPVSQWRVVLRSGQTVIVNGTEAAKTALLDALTP